MVAATAGPDPPGVPRHAARRRRRATRSARARRPGSTRRCSCRWRSAGARSACSPPSAATRRGRTSGCCWRSPPARRPRSPPRGRSRRSACASRSPARRPSARAGRASCTTRRCRTSAACACSSPPRAGATTRRDARRPRGGPGQIDAEIRAAALISELRPAALDALGPAPAIEELAARTGARHGLEVTTELAFDGAPLGRGRDRALPDHPGGADQRRQARRRRRASRSRRARPTARCG